MSFVRNNVRNQDPRVNFRIRVPKVRVIDQNGGQAGILDTKDALRMAQEAGLDLVEVAPLERPPVCRIMDYGKFKYQQKKKHQKHHGGHLKGIRLSPKIQEHDLIIKAEHARKFLERGDKVNVTMLFRGREMTHIDIGRDVFRRFVEILGDAVKIERDAQMEGKRLSAILAPGRGALKTAMKPRPKPAAEPAAAPLAPPDARKEA